MTGTDTGHSWIWIAYVKDDDDGKVAGFAIDERDFPDPDAARAVVSEAGDELQRRRMILEFENIRVRNDAPALDLSTWAEFRQRLDDSPHQGAG